LKVGFLHRWRGQVLLGNLNGGVKRNATADELMEAKRVILDDLVAEAKYVHSILKPSFRSNRLRRGIRHLSVPELIPETKRQSAQKPARRGIYTEPWCESRLDLEKPGRVRSKSEMLLAGGRW
jgi:hypothetical protein